jgi:hypothetical protein
VFPKDTEAPPGGVDDMTKLSYLHEPGVLQNLAARYELNEIYVSHITLFPHFNTVLMLKQVTNIGGKGNIPMMILLLLSLSRHTLAIS